MTFTEETAALALTRYPGLTQSQGLAVVRYYGSALAAMEDASPAEERWARLSQDKAARLSAYDFAQRQAEWCAETGVRVLPLSHPDYPALLRDCPDPPAVLYYQGTARLNRRHSLSVVGTRRITDYGKRLCADLMAGLSALLPDTLVVSGLAYGVDIHAHRAAFLEISGCAEAEFTPKTILTDEERADLVYAVKVAVKNDGFLKIGMYGEVKL